LVRESWICGKEDLALSQNPLWDHVFWGSKKVDFELMLLQENRSKIKGNANSSFFDLMNIIFWFILNLKKQLCDQAFYY
jgi:hypothetical protein